MPATNQNFDPMDNSPIPVTFGQYWADIRMRLIPAAFFLLAILCIALLWKGYVASPTLLGQAESLTQNVSCYKPGVLMEFKVERFQKLKAGDPIAVVMVTEPRILTASLAVAAAEIEALRLTMPPVLSQQNAVITYDHFRLDWMKQRAVLGTSRVNLQLAELEARRMSDLYHDKIISQRVYEQAIAARDRLLSEVTELERMVLEQATNFTQVQITNMVNLGNLTNNSLQATIAVLDSKLRLTEAELSPITLRAPVDGTVANVLHRNGEAVNAGDPIISLATDHASRIIGYLRDPLGLEPTVGMQVEIRTRSQHRQSGLGKILALGSQMEAIVPALMPNFKATPSELGLPLSVSVPSNLKIRPGELVELTIHPAN